MGNINWRKNCLLLALLSISTGLILSLPARANAVDSLCAVVKIAISQELTLERQAFDAHMRIDNGLSHISLEDVSVEVNFNDEDGNAVLASSDPDHATANFFISADSAGITGDSNNWRVDTVNPSSSVDLHWLIIPAPGSSNDIETGTLYYVGATLKYSIGGEENITKVSPDYIYVKPLPELQLDYFLTKDVFGDDAWTSDTEPPVPFILGARIKNNGSGIARNLKIESAHPKITENEQGLFIGFTIEESEVNGKPSPESLLIDFGDIASGTASVGRWIMSCTLSGSFNDFIANVSHSDELGGELTSLIKQEDIHTYFLLKDVLVDIPGRDGISDFLATDGRVYESEGTDSPVTDWSDPQRQIQPSSNDIWTLSIPATTGFMYVQADDPYVGTMELKEVYRNDGKQIKSENAWLSSVKSGRQPRKGVVSLFFRLVIFSFK